MKKIINTILLILNAVALLLMLGSTMAGVVPPSKFIGFSLLSYGYLYLVLLNVLFVIVWLWLLPFFRFSSVPFSRCSICSASVLFSISNSRFPFGSTSKDASA